MNMKFCEVYNVTKTSDLQSSGGIHICSDDVLISGSLIKGSHRNGITIDECSPTIINCAIVENNYTGISDRGNVPIIKGNFIANNKDDGIYTRLSSANIEGNLITGNFNSGIYANMGSQEIHHNRIISNGHGHYSNKGIYCVNTDTYVHDNIIALNSNDGVWIQGRSIIFENNIVSSNVRYGINLWQSGSPTVSNNVIASNGYIGIYNTAYGNIINNFIINNTEGIRYIWGDTVATNNLLTSNQYGLVFCLDDEGSACYNNFNNNIKFGVRYFRGIEGPDTDGDGLSDWIEAGFVEETSPVDVRNSWWGDVSGPAHPDNPSGSGDNVSNEATYAPWISSPTYTKPLAFITHITPHLILEGEKVRFNGLGADPDDRIESYLWSSSKDGQLSNECSFTSSDLSVGTHIISFKVQDNDGHWSNLTTQEVIVTSSDNLPKAWISSITPNSSEAGGFIHFNGHGVDPDGYVAQYYWRSNIDGWLNGESYFCSSSLSAGEHTIFLKVKDGNGIWSLEDSMILTIAGSPTIADAGPDQHVTQGTIVAFNGSKSKDDIGIQSYIWTFFDGTLQTLTGLKPTYQFNNAGIFQVVLNVTNVLGKWNTDLMRVFVTDGLIPIANAGPDEIVEQGEKVTFNGNGSSDNIGIVNYTWNFIYQQQEIYLYDEITEFTFHEPGIYVITLNTDFRQRDRFHN